METKYRVSFEVVNPISHPDVYRGDRPSIPAYLVPENYWHRVERITDDLDSAESQFQGLLTQIAEGELIRNPLLETSTVKWSVMP